MLDIDHKRQLRNERQKVKRLRRKLGLAVVPVEVDSDVIDLIVRNNWLSDGDAHDRVKVGDAIARMLKATTRHGGSSVGTRRC